MQQRPNITFQNYQQFKPSEFIAAGIIDLQNAIESGLEINMSSWFSFNEETRNCTMCLGGAVLYGMHKDIKENIDKKNWPSACDIAQTENILKFALLFDEIRAGAVESVVYHIQKLYPLLQLDFLELCLMLETEWERGHFLGKLFLAEIKPLINSIKSLVNVLEKIGL